MKEYVISCAGIGLIAAIGASVSHDGLKKATRAALGIIILLVLLTPLSSLFSDLLASVPNLPEYGAGDTDSFAELTGEAFRAGAEKAVEERFSLAEECVSIVIEGFEPSLMRAEYIRARLTDVGTDYRLIKEYISEHFLIDGGICEVEYDMQ